ncbi:MAG: hypothetical protein IPK26_31440 [Planctomycetes bacterium]|nr:hypothetical protein [Planctomycetota bacterium]
MRSSRSGRGLGMALGLVSAAASAQEELSALVADLATPELQEAAVDRLCEQGARAVPALRACLAEPLASATQLCAAMLVAGSLAGHAFTTLPDLRRLYQFHDDAAVRRQAMWAIAAIGSTCTDRALLRELWLHLRDRGSLDADLFLADVAYYRLLLAERAGVFYEDDPERRDWAPSHWLFKPASTIAIAERLNSGLAVAMPRMRERLLACLAAATDRSCQSWERRRTWDAATGELAVAAWSSLREQTPAVARGLLQYWDPRWRVHGLQVLAGQDAWFWRERLDVVARLNDADSRVRAHAHALVATFGAEGLLAMPTLRVPFGTLAQTAERDVLASSLLRAAIAATPAQEATLRALDEALFLRPKSGVAVTAADAAMVAAMLRGCGGVPGPVIAAVTRTLAPGNVTPEIVEALLMHLERDDVRDVVVAALIRLGPAVLRVQPEFEVQVARACMDRWVRGAVFALQAEIMAGSSASTDELRHAAASTTWSVAVRAWLELVQRGVVFDPELLRVVAAGATADWPLPWIAQGSDWGDRTNRGSSGTQLAAPGSLVTRAAALVVSTAGRDDRRVAAGELLRELRRTLGGPADGW